MAATNSSTSGCDANQRIGRRAHGRVVQQLKTGVERAAVGQLAVGGKLKPSGNCRSRAVGHEGHAALLAALRTRPP